MKQLVLWGANYIGWEKLLRNARTYLKTLELGLGDLEPRDLIIWQNRKGDRSVPGIPCCHVYVRLKPQPAFRRPSPAATPPTTATPCAEPPVTGGVVDAPSASNTSDDGGATGADDDNDHDIVITPTPSM